MDGVVVYTADAPSLWTGLMAAAGRQMATVHGKPPSLAIELPGARLYVDEGAVEDGAPGEVEALRGDVRQFVIDIHNAAEAEPFLATALAGLVTVVDDDHGNVTSGADYVRRWLDRS